MWRRVLRYAWRSALTLAAAGSLSATGIILYAWLTSNSHPLALRQERFEPTHKPQPGTAPLRPSARANVCFTTDQLLFERGEFMWQRTRLILAPQPIPSAGNGWSTDPDPLSAAPDGRVCGFEAVHRSEAYSEPELTFVAVPLWVPLSFGATLPLVWTLAAARWWLRWRRERPHRKAGFDPLLTATKPG